MRQNSASFLFPCIFHTQADFECGLEKHTDSDESVSPVVPHGEDGRNRRWRKKRSRHSADCSDEENSTPRKKIIRSEHILKIAAELLMDFS